MLRALRRPPRSCAPTRPPRAPAEAAPSRGAGYLGAALAAVALAPLLSGCAARIPAGATALDDVRVEGAREVDEGDVLAAIRSEPTAAVLGVHLWWVSYGLYDRARVEADLARIERYYRTRGFLEARVRAGRVVPTGERRVRVEVVIEEGARLTLDALRFEGLDGLTAPVRAAITDAWTLVAGDPVDEELYRDSVPAAERALTDAGYAHASVTVALDVDASRRRATLRVVIAAGPACTLGAITLRGLERLNEADLRAVVGLTPGERYSTRRLRDARAALRGLDALAEARIEPELGDGRATAIPIVITVREAALRRLEIVPGARLDAERDEAHVRLTWRSRDFLGGLRELAIGGAPSLSLARGLGGEEAARPGLATDVTLRQPGLLERRTIGAASLAWSILPDPANEFRTERIGGALWLERRFGPYALATFAYRRAVELPRAYDAGPLPASALPAGRRAAQVGYLELTIRVDRLDAPEAHEALAAWIKRDPTRAPRRGYDLSLSLQAAPTTRTFLAGDLADVRSRAELRLFAPIAKGVVLAFRFMTGFVLPIGYDAHAPARRAADADDPSTYAADMTGEVPYSRAFFSGGAGSNRGYAGRWIGLRDCAPRPDGGRELGASCSQLVGGASVWEGSVELRVELADRLAAALFLDASDVSRDLFDLRLGYPHLSIGPAVRWDSPFGPLELALGVRVPGAQRLGGALDPREAPRDTTLFGGAPVALHLQLAEPF